MTRSGAALAVEPDVPFNPFPGLRPFEPEENFLFFGRERQTDELLRKLRTTRFLSVVGTSGSGKSSLVRSGLIPSLYGGGMTQAGSRWHVAMMNPGEDPIRNLAAALRDPKVLGHAAQEPWSDAFVETTLRASKLGLVECIRQARLPEGTNLLIFIDQFEELFRYKRNRREAGRDEAVAFVKLLIAARESDVPCYITLTMRSDFIGDCMEFPAMPEIINHGLYLVPRLTRDELRAAITGPVAVGGATISPRLVSRLLNDIGDDLDQLPILQHALMRTWDRWEEERNPDAELDLRHYLDIGTMRTALHDHAQAAFEEELDAKQRVIATKLFKALTDVSTDPRGVRRPVPVKDILALTGATLRQVEDVVNVFRKQGRSFLLPRNVKLDEESILDISHESLMRTWRTLARWTEEEAQSARMYVSLAKAAEQHELKKEAYWGDPKLQLALDWRAKQRPTQAWAERYDPSFARAMKFLDKSAARRRRERLLKRALIGILLGALIVMFGLALYARRTAGRLRITNTRLEKARKDAEKAKEEAVGAYNQLVTSGKKLRDALGREQSSRRGELIALGVAQQKTRDAEERTRDMEIARAGEQAALKEAQENEATANKERQSALKAQGEAVEERDRTKRAKEVSDSLTNLASGRALALKITQPNLKSLGPLAAHLALEAYRIHQTNNGKAEDRPDLYVAMRTVLERLNPSKLLQIQGNIRAQALTRDGKTTVVGTNDGRVLLVPLDGSPTTVLHTFASPVRAAAVSGNRLAVGSAAGEVWVWDLARGETPLKKLAAGGAVSSLAFSQGMLAAGVLEGTIRLWNLDRPEDPVATLETDTNRQVRAVDFSPDGTILAAGFGAPLPGSSPKSAGAAVWRTRALAPPSYVCLQLPGIAVRSIAVAGDNDRVACGGESGEIAISVLAENAAPGLVLTGHRSWVNALSFDRGGGHLASAGSDRTVRLWDVRHPESSVVLRSQSSYVWTLAFTSDGDRVITGGEDGTIWTWPARMDVLARELCAVAGPAPSRTEWKNVTDVPYPEKPLCPQELK